MSGTPDNKRKRPVTPTKIDESGRKLEEIVELPGYNEENQSISSELKVTTNIALIGYSAAVTSEVQEDQAQEIVAPSNVDGEKQNDNSPYQDSSSHPRTSRISQYQDSSSHPRTSRISQYLDSII